jgi:hypothetical protein
MQKLSTSPMGNFITFAALNASKLATAVPRQFIGHTGGTLRRRVALALALGLAAQSLAQVAYNYSTDLANPVTDTSGQWTGDSGTQAYVLANTEGGQVAYNTQWNVQAGYFGSYIQTSINVPTKPGTPNDRANCTLQFIGPNDTFTIGSSTLANGTPVSVVLYCEATETIETIGPGNPSFPLQGEQVGTSEITFSAVYEGQGTKTVSGTWYRKDFVDYYGGTMNPTTHVLSGTISFSGKVGDSFSFNEVFASFGNVQSYSGGLYDFQVGLGATWGLDPASSPGFFLTSKETGQEWTGTYGDSASYVPTNPEASGLPNLIIAYSGNGVIVSWPDPNTNSYTLQQNNDLANTNNWGTTVFPITLANGTNSIIIAPPTGNLYFRLKQ